MSQQRSIDALELGGTLFVPASHKNLEAVLSGEKYPELRSIVIDFEDGLANTDRQQALHRLENILENLQEVKLLRFIRPQNPQMLKEFLQRKNIEKIDGFILPKFGLENAGEYLSIIQDRNFMPSIEGKELFDIQQLQKLREILLPHKNQITCIRFGAQDMLRQLGLKQSGSIYQMLAPAQVITNLITTFKPAGFDISAPVYPDFSDKKGFQKEVAYELKNGLVSKTIIHPCQIESISTIYKVSTQELKEAKETLSQHDGVLNIDGKMGEVSTQSAWAHTILTRYNTYGIKG